MAQEMKFDQSQLGNMLGVYQAMITAAPADLIATPETAVPVTAQQVPPDYLPGLANFARQSGSHLLIGLPISDSPADYTNGLIVYDPTAPATGTTGTTGTTSLASTASTTTTTTTTSTTSITGTATPYRYDKHHLVPFGEFIPQGFHWFVALMHIPLGDLTRGAVLQPPFAVRDQWVLPNICYEDLFGEEIAAQIRARSERGLPMPTMLLNISNIAWFGDSIALPQHLQISQMRTLETGRPMLRATNTGATAVIGAHGQIQAELKPFTRAVLSASVQGYGGLTPFIRFGNTSIVLLGALLIGIGCLLHRRRR
jgi:apolipoprotein N-acyltransferase